ncbi:MAG: hypothetical protein C4297_02240 [Gemmataceae bacterium]
MTGAGSLLYNHFRIRLARRAPSALGLSCKCMGTWPGKQGGGATRRGSARRFRKECVDGEPVAGGGLLVSFPDSQSSSEEFQGREYQDPHYHDEEVLPSEEEKKERIVRKQDARREIRRLLKRRRHTDD